MKKYICNNKDCRNVWESIEEPFECPKCHSANISPAEKESALVSILKKWWWAAVVAIAVVGLIILLIPKDIIRVSTDADKDMHILRVELNGDGASQYAVVLKRNNIILQQTNPEGEGSEANYTFNNLYGDVSLEFLWLGSGSAPKLGNYTSLFHFAEETYGNSDNDEPKVKVEIESLNTTPNLISNPGDKYTVLVILSKQSTSDVEFSMDNKKWVQSNTFNGLAPGSYTFYARNRSENTYCDKRDCTLKSVAPKITAEQINALLRKVADYDDAAADKLSPYNSIPVIGVKNVPDFGQLVTNVSNGSSITVVSIQTNGDGSIKSFTAKE